MFRFRSLAAVLLLFLAMTAAALAQSPGAPPLSKTDKVLYAHHQSTDTVELIGWANTLKTDGDDTAMGPSASCAQHSGQSAVDEQLLAANGVAMDRTLGFPLTPAQSGTMTLDPAGAITATVYVGSGSCFGKVDITAALMSGSTKVAEGKATGHVWSDTTAAYPSKTITLTATAKDIPLAGLNLTIRLVGKTGGAAFVGISEAKGSTNIALPILSVTGGASQPSVTHEVLQGAVSRTFTLTNATNQTYAYNWTTSGGPHILQFAGNLSEGNASVLLRSTSSVLFNQTQSGSFNQTADISPSEGVWSLNVTFAGAKGNVTLTIEPFKEDLVTPTTTTSSNSSTNTSSPGKKAGGIPVPTTVALTALLLAVVAARRRRDA